MNKRVWIIAATLMLLFAGMLAFGIFGMSPSDPYLVHKNAENLCLS